MNTINLKQKKKLLIEALVLVVVGAFTTLALDTEPKTIVTFANVLHQDGINVEIERSQEVEINHFNVVFHRQYIHKALVRFDCQLVEQYVVFSNMPNLGVKMSECREDSVLLNKDNNTLIIQTFDGYIRKFYLDEFIDTAVFENE